MAAWSPHLGAFPPDRTRHLILYNRNDESRAVRSCRKDEVRASLDVESGAGLPVCERCRHKVSIYKAWRQQYARPGNPTLGAFDGA